MVDPDLITYYNVLIGGNVGKEGANLYVKRLGTIDSLFAIMPEDTILIKLIPETP